MLWVPRFTGSGVTLSVPLACHPPVLAEELGAGAAAVEPGAAANTSPPD